MTTPDFPDWANPSASVEQVSAQLIPGSSLASNGAAADLDTSRYATLSVAYGGPGLLAGQAFQLQFQWLLGAQTVGWDAVVFHDPTATDVYPLAQTAQVPVRATRCLVRIIGEASAACGVNLWGSTRRLDIDRPRLSRYQFGTLLLETPLTATAAGADQPLLRTPPVSRAVAIKVACNVATTPFRLLAQGPSWSAAAFTRARLGLWTANGDITVDDVPVPNQGLEWTLTNLDTVSRSIRLSVWDVS